MYDANRDFAEWESIAKWILTQDTLHATALWVIDFIQSGILIVSTFPWFHLFNRRVYWVSICNSGSRNGTNNSTESGLQIHSEHRLDKKQAATMAYCTNSSILIILTLTYTLCVYTKGPASVAKYGLRPIPSKNADTCYRGRMLEQQSREDLTVSMTSIREIVRNSPETHHFCQQNHRQPLSRTFSTTTTWTWLVTSFAKRCISLLILTVLCPFLHSPPSLNVCVSSSVPLEFLLLQNFVGGTALR